MGDEALSVTEAAPGDTVALEQSRQALLTLRGALAQERCRSLELEHQLRAAREEVADYRDEAAKYLHWYETAMDALEARDA